MARRSQKAVSMTSTTAHQSGLARFRQRQAEAKAERMAALEELRKDATTEVVDGREFRVVRIPDRYDFANAPAVARRPLYHRHSVQLAHGLPPGPSPSTGGPAP